MVANPHTDLGRRKAENNSISLFLRELFDAFGREGIDYAVARDYELLPTSVEGRDLDVLVRRGDMERAYHIVRKAANVFSAEVVRIDQEFSFWLLVIHLDGSWALRVDIGSVDSHTWRGISHLNLNIALERKVCDKGIYMLRGEDVIVIQFCRDMMGRFRLREKYHSPVRNLYLSNPSYLMGELEKIVGRRCAGRLMEVCGQGRFEHSATLGKEMRRSVITRSLLQEPIRTVRSILLYIGWRCHEYFRPNGVMVAVIGLDGAGKGTLIREIQGEISRMLHFPVRTYHWRPGLLPSLGSLLLGRVEDGRPVRNPHSRKASSIVPSIFRLAYYTLDYVIGYWLLVRPILGRKCIAAIFDRYYYDYFIDPLRFRTSVPRSVIRFFGVFVPKPDVVLLLSCEPKTLYRRRCELPVDELERQACALGDLGRLFKNAVWIDTSCEIEISIQQMRGAILDALKMHLRRY